MNPTSQTSDCYCETILSLKGAVYTQSMCTCVWRYGRYSWLQHRDKGSCSFGTNGLMKTNTQENNQNWWKISGKNKNLIGDHLNVANFFGNFLKKKDFNWENLFGYLDAHHPKGNLNMNSTSKHESDCKHWNDPQLDSYFFQIFFINFKVHFQ